MFPIHLNLGFTTLYFYEAIYYIISIGVGGFMGYKALKKIGFSTEDFSDMLFSVVIGLIFGARLSHFLFWNPEIFFSNPLVFFKVWEGGASVTGGIIFAIVGAAICLKIKKRPFFHSVAVLAPAALIGQAIGRVGCFLNGDAHGIYTTLPWGVHFPRFGRFFPSFEISKGQSSYAWTYSQSNSLPGHTQLASAPLHPTQLYEALGDIAIALIIIFFLLRIAEKSGKWSMVFFFHTGMYAIMRFLLEFIRADRVNADFFGMSLIQILLFLYAVGALGFSLVKFLQKTTPTELPHTPA
jgi:phosphatidylglycerol:prolipoprotein diacylglycerol transferase